MIRMLKHIESQDEILAAATRHELARQRDTIELIASENFVSQAVMEATASVLTNKYAEGYSGRRYYGGCEHVDTVEDIANQRLKQLFGAEHANVRLIPVHRRIWLYILPQSRWEIRFLE